MLLEDLVDHNLLTEHAPGRYRLHDLLRAHARTLATAADPGPERDGAWTGCCTTTRTPRRAPRTPSPAFPGPNRTAPAPAHSPALSDPDAARAWLRTEHPNLEAAFTHARTHALDGHTVALAAGLADILLTDGPWPAPSTLHHAAAEAAERLAEPAGQATALTDLGRAWIQTGDFPGAGEAFTRAWEIYRELGHRAGEGTTLIEPGPVCSSRPANVPVPSPTSTRALEIYRETGHRLGEATR